MKNLSALLLVLTPTFALGDEQPILSWQVTPPLPVALGQDPAYPHFTQIFGVPWHERKSDEGGWLILEDPAAEGSTSPRSVWARASHSASAIGTLRVNVQHEGALRLFWNGAPAMDCTGECPAGGEHAGVELGCVRGLNELLVKSVQGSSGWALAVSCDRAFEAPTKEHDRAKRVWQTPAQFLTPECVLHDPERDLVLMLLGEGRGNMGPVMVYALKYRSDAR